MAVRQVGGAQPAGRLPAVARGGRQRARGAAVQPGAQGAARGVAAGRAAREARRVHVPRRPGRRRLRHRRRRHRRRGRAAHTATDGRAGGGIVPRARVRAA
eukprot:1144331-Prymnesium_polylepis.1